MACGAGMRFAGKVAVVTGSTKGIGFAIARRFAEEGAKVMISSRNQDNVDEAVARLRFDMLDVSGTVCHIGNHNDRTHLLQKTLQTYRKIDTLVMSAGINPYVGPFLKTPESKWERIFDVNVKSAFLLARDVIPHLEQTKGSILINSSITGLYPNADLGAYSCSKAALNALVVCLALECGRMGVRVNGLLPAVVEQTDFARVLTEGDNAEGLQKRSVLGRFGTPEECAGAAAFLCSEDASYITGENISLSGGPMSNLNAGV